MRQHLHRRLEAEDGVGGQALVAIDTLRSAFAGAGKKKNDNDNMAPAILYSLQALAGRG